MQIIVYLHSGQHLGWLALMSYQDGRFKIRWLSPEILLTSLTLTDVLLVIQSEHYHS